MKKIILLFALLSSLTSFAQVTFPWRKPDILLGKEVKVKPIKTNEIETGYRDFFSDELLQKHYLGDKYYSPVESLLGRTFKVTAVDPVAEKDYCARLKLIDEATGETIYYSYAKNVASFFDFEIIGGLTLPANYYCDYIVPSKTSPAGKGFETTEIDGIFFKKYTEWNKSSIGYVALLDIRTKQIVDTNGKEMTILLDNGKQIHTSEGLISEDPSIANNGDYIIIGVFGLTKSDMALLKANSVIGFKIMNAEKTISANNSAILSNMINCLINKQLK